MAHRIRRCFPLLLLATWFCVTTQAQARISAPLPEMPSPPQGEVQWVAKNMRMNGLPMTLQTFQSRLNPDELLRYYESQAYRWGRSEYRRSTSQEWQLLGIKMPGYYITVQARAAVGGSEGTIATSPTLQRATAKISSDFPLPRTVRILSVQQYDDAGMESEHLSLVSPRAVAIEAQAFAQELAHAGWQVVRRQSMQTIPRGIVIEAQRAAQQALLTLLPDRTQTSVTAIVIVWKKS